MNALANGLVLLNHAGWGHGDGWGGEYWWVGRLLMVLFWVVLIVVAVWFVRRNWRPSEPTGIERARGILAERFARGEIDAEEYRERLGQLV